MLRNFVGMFVFLLLLTSLVAFPVAVVQAYGWVYGWLLTIGLVAAVVAIFGDTSPPEDE